MIYAVGDSHAQFTFAGVPGVIPHHLGPVTLKRVGYLEDDLLPNAVAQLGLTPADVLLLCFGEIDCRCYVKPQVEHRKISLDELVAGWVERYLARAITLDVHGARIAVLSVVPASPLERTYNSAFPVLSTDGERALYVLRLNRWLRAGCETHGLAYVDVHTFFSDPLGMLPFSLSDGCVHVRDADRVTAALHASGLL